jgi:hypothetical protein
MAKQNLSILFMGKVFYLLCVGRILTSWLFISQSYKNISIPTLLKEAFCPSFSLKSSTGWLHEARSNAAGSVDGAEVWGQRSLGEGGQPATVPSAPQLVHQGFWRRGPKNLGSWPFSHSWGAARRGHLSLRLLRPEPSGRARQTHPVFIHYLKRVISIRDIFI